MSELNKYEEKMATDRGQRGHRGAKRLGSKEEYENQS